jgi:L-alanine-DL-glutamate epimerase-like enolase superfamily enzyme
MGGITGLLRCAALAQAHGGELVSHQTQPMIGHLANLHVCAAQLHLTKPCEWNDPTDRMHAIFDEPPLPKDGKFHLSDRPGLGIDFIEHELTKRRIDV